MKKNKKVLGLVLVSALSLTLAACGENPKETYTGAVKKSASLETYKVVTDAKFSLDVSKVEGLSEEEKAEYEKMTKATYALTQVVDQKAEKYEMIFDVTYDNVSYNLPVLVDAKDQKIYIKFIDVLNAVPAAAPYKSYVEGKTAILLDLKEMNAQLPEKDRVDLEKTNAKVLEKIVVDEFISFLETKNEKDFAKNKNAVKVSLTEKDVKTLTLSVSEKMAKVVNGKEMSKEEKEEVKNELNESFKEISIDELSSSVVTDKDGYVKSEIVVLKVSSKHEKDNGASVKITVTNTYSELNKKASFSIEPSKENLITSEELFRFYMMAMMSGYEVE